MRIQDWRTGGKGWGFQGEERRDKMLSDQNWGRRNSTRPYRENFLKGKKKRSFQEFLHAREVWLKGKGTI